ncbi:helix-turn-helix domain-containing protein [Capillimicrobium parvum]|uniref:HTH arsR-type domain-containing protein n=1 Tax=Capillimicrobium parvum TaxID=2884022 RepID=A0A9E6XT02_9ACTN|nr:helix-turn-helix domain-containing protein [Capillimicrobium parvum]UGS34104.1 hypothetical protein DSM104329_00475 [Capillimicrobium parvum]
MPFEPRRLTDPREMRALAHPVRLALLEALAHAGRPLTATEASELVDESPSSCSFHLRQLAKYGFVEEAEGGAGRRRPWRLAQLGLSFSDAGDDPQLTLAATALERTLRHRYLARAEQALDSRAALEPEWREVTGTDQFVLYATPEEVRELNAELVALLTRFHDRVADVERRPPGSRPVEVIALTYPVDRPDPPG